MTWDAVYAALGDLEKQDVERLRQGAVRACALLDNIQERLGVTETNGVAILKAVDQRNARIAELEAAIDKLAQCKGRFHTEANFKALIAVREKNLHK